MLCPTCGSDVDPQQMARTGRCPRCGTLAASGASNPPSGSSGSQGQRPPHAGAPVVVVQKKEHHPAGADRCADPARAGERHCGVIALVKASSTNGPSWSYQTYPGGTYSIDYPSDWQVTPQPGGGVQFDGSSGQQFFIFMTQDTGQSLSQYASDVCQTYVATEGTSSVTVGGLPGTRLECMDGNNQEVADAVVYQGEAYVLSYESDPNSFASDQQQYYTPMEQSFTFLPA